MIKRTREEQEALVKQWRESGKKLAIWCREQNIPKTTFFYWIQRDKTKERITRDHFTELKEATPTPTGIVIEWRGCKIHADQHTAPQILEKCLRIIGRSSC